MIGSATPVLPAEDLGRATAFYTEKLGMTVESSSDEGNFLRFGDGTRVFIYPFGPATATNTAAAFFVDDLEAEVAALRKRGVAFQEFDFPGLKTVDGIADLKLERSAWFMDTEGNTIALGELR